MPNLGDINEESWDTDQDERTAQAVTVIAEKLRAAGFEPIVAQADCLTVVIDDFDYCVTVKEF